MTDAPPTAKTFLRRLTRLDIAIVVGIFAIQCGVTGYDLWGPHLPAPWTLVKSLLLPVAWGAIASAFFVLYRIVHEAEADADQICKKAGEIIEEAKEDFDGWKTQLSDALAKDRVQFVWVTSELVCAELERLSDLLSANPEMPKDLVVEALQARVSLIRKHAPEPPLEKNPKEVLDWLGKMKSTEKAKEAE